MLDYLGQFPVCGTTIVCPDTFTGCTNPVEAGQTYRSGYAFVRYQIPVKPKEQRRYSRPHPTLAPSQPPRRLHPTNLHITNALTRNHSRRGIVLCYYIIMCYT